MLVQPVYRAALVCAASLLWSGCKDGITDPADVIPPPVPEILGATAVSASSIRITFSPVQDDGGGVVEYLVSRNGTQVGRVTAESFTDEGLDGTQVYTYTIAAVDDCGNASAMSTPWRARADPMPPQVTSTTPADGAAGVATNTALSATFTMEMNPRTLNGSTFTLNGPSGAVGGTVTYSGVTAVLRPTSALAPNTQYTATITPGAHSLGGIGLPANHTWRFATGSTADASPSFVVSTVPANNATGVAVNTAINIVFNEPLDPETVNGSTVTVSGPGGAVAGSLSFSGTTATFRPGTVLAANTQYTVNVTTGVRDLAGNPMAAPYTFRFTTGGAAGDASAPTVTSTTPARGATNVAVNTAASATFSEAMDPATITTQTLFLTGPGGSRVPGTVSYSGTTAIFRPAAALAPNTPYTGTVTTGARDLAGNPLAADYTWSFTTGSTTSADRTPPAVSSTQPPNGAVGVAVNTAVSATFTEPLDPASVTTETFFAVGPGGQRIPGTVTFSDRTATFRPAANLAPGTQYTMRVTTGVRDLAGNPLAADYVWRFTTGSGTGGDVTPPSVIGVAPPNAATGVEVNTRVNVAFSEAMDPATIHTGTVYLTGPGGATISATVTLDGSNATLRPNATLAPGTSYTVNVTTGARDLAGNPLAAPFTSTFTTGSGTGGDVTPPTVDRQNPPCGATGVSLDAAVRITFSEPLDASTVNASTILVASASGAVAGTVTYEASTNTVVFTPLIALAAAETYTVTVLTAVADLAGNALATVYVCSFTTAAVDSGAPTIIATSPVAGATDAATNTIVTATFDEPLDASTVNAGTFLLTAAGVPVVGTVTYDAATRTARFTPAVQLATSTLHAATLTTGIRDLDGNAMASNFVFTFTTVATP